MLLRNWNFLISLHYHTNFSIKLTFKSIVELGSPLVRSTTQYAPMRLLTWPIQWRGNNNNNNNNKQYHKITTEPSPTTTNE